MRKLLLRSILVIAAVAPAATLLAAGHGNGGGGMHATGAPHSAAATNSNGIKSADRDKGLDRAADRRNIHSVTRKHAKKSKVKNK